MRQWAVIFRRAVVLMDGGKPFTVPDSPASWRLYLVAHDRKFRCGVFCADVTVTPSARSD